MVRKGTSTALAGLLAGGLLLGCDRPPAPGGAPPAPSPANHLRPVVALGDSVPRGTNCDCTPYPPLTAEDLGRATGYPVAAVNDSVAGYTTDGVLRQLSTNDDVSAHVGGAGVVEIEVGANDVAHTKSCGTTLSCYTDKIPYVEKNLTTIVTRVRELAQGPPALIILLDYWSVWLGGSYAAEEGEAYVATAGELTAAVNTAIKSVATSAGCVYVDLRTAFKGPDYAYDETHYLSGDGDHPNAAGHRQIAAAAAEATRTTLHLETVRPS